MGIRCRVVEARRGVCSRHRRAASHHHGAGCNGAKSGLVGSAQIAGELWSIMRVYAGMVGMQKVAVRAESRALVSCRRHLLRMVSGGIAVVWVVFWLHW